MQIKSVILSGAALALSAGLIAGVPGSAVHAAPAVLHAAKIDPTPTSDQAAGAAPEAYYDHMRSFAPFANQSDINLDFVSHGICGGLAALGYADYSADLERLPLSKFQTLQLMSLVVPQFCPTEESAVVG